ncbi:hypothetical protein SprV_0501757100 [Sparganum proliferum]
MPHYNQPVPPVYGLNNLDIPMKLYWGGDDWLSAPEDVRRLLAELSKRPYIRDMYLPHYNHVEFMWGMDAGKLIYSDILDFFREFQIGHHDWLTFASGKLSHVLDADSTDLIYRSDGFSGL